MKLKIYACDIEVSFFPKKYMNRLQEYKKKGRKKDYNELLEHHVLKRKISLYPVTLDENGIYPSPKYKKSLTENLWKYFNKTTSVEHYVGKIVLLNKKFLGNVINHNYF